MRTKWFRVCQSGKTIDGREITPQQIDEMAESYNPRTYGARVFVEHFRSILPDSPLSALGDVLALKAETDSVTGARVLLAQVDATDRLVKLAQNRDKSYWSIEMAPNMAGTGKAYMLGLSVTDTPASLGTELIKLSAAPEHRATLPEGMRDHLFGAPVENGPLEPDTAPAPAADPGPSLVDRVRTLLTGQDRRTDARLHGLESATVEIAGTLGALRDQLTTLTRSPSTAGSPPLRPAATAAGATSPPSSPSAPAAPNTDPVAALTAEVAALREALSRIPATAGRPLSAGGTTAAPLKTDC